MQTLEWWFAVNGRIILVPDGLCQPPSFLEKYWPKAGALRGGGGGGKNMRQKL